MIFLGRFLIYSLFVVGLISFCGRTWGQQVLPFARLKPLDNSQIAMARKGEPAFLDVDLTFNQVPDVLKGCAFTKSSKIVGCAIAPLTAGTIIVATPVKGK